MPADSSPRTLHASLVCNEEQAECSTGGQPLPVCMPQERMRLKLEKQKEELAEYEESRREEREKEAAEIAALRAKRVRGL